MEEETKKIDEKISPSFIEVVERMEKANKEAREILARQEELVAKKLLGGISDLGQTPKIETEQEKWEREAKIRYKGTGMDPTPTRK